MARKQDKLRPYRVDYFNIDEMKDNDLALVRSVVKRAVTAANAAGEVIADNSALPIVLIRSYRYYKQITSRKDVYKAVEDLFNEKNALIVMGEVEKYRAAQTPVVPDHATPDPAFGVDKATFYKTNAGTTVQAQTPPQPPADENGHVTRFSDSSLYDEVCINCGATDTSGKLEQPCSNTQKSAPIAAVARTAAAIGADPKVLAAHTVDVLQNLSGPTSPATVAAITDLQGFLSHDEHEQIMDKVVVTSTDAEGRRYPTAENTLEHGDDIAAAVSAYHDVFPEPPALNNPMPGTPSINPFVVTSDEPLSLQLKVLAFALVTIVVLSGLIYFLRH